MARHVRFPLIMGNGTEVRTLEELQNNFDLESVLGYFSDGRLQTWLTNRYLNHAAEAVGALSADQPDLNERLCEILGVGYQKKQDIDLDAIQRRNEKKRIVAGLTSNKTVLEHIDAVALTQEELADLASTQTTNVYLCGTVFTIPFKANIRYIGVNDPLIHLEHGRYLDEYTEAGIILEGVQLENSVQNNCHGIRMFLNGRYQEAFPIIQQEAENGNPRAMYILAMYYDEGYNMTAISRERCLQWCKNAKLSDEPLLLFGYMEWCTDDTNEVFEICEQIFPQLNQLAEQGNALAESALASVYASHYYDTENAIKWYRLAAAQGLADAQFRLGTLYEKADSAADNLQAVGYIEKAAVQGHIKAQYALGLRYYIGRTAKKDDAKAAEWFRKAAAQGSAEAKHYLESLYFDDVPAGQTPKAEAAKDTKTLFQTGQKYYIENEYGKAAEWYRKAAELGDANAQHNLGCMYLKGMGVPQDEREAAQWFLKAAEQGFAESQYNLGNMYRSGKGVQQSNTKALIWFTKAAEQGDVEAQQSLGAIYYYAKNYQTAAKWFRKAAEQDNATAQCNLAYMYEKGIGVSKDSIIAFEWYRKAAKQGNTFAAKKMKENGYSV